MQNSEMRIPLRAIMWVIDKQNFKAIPFILNKEETKAKNILTGEVVKLNERGLTHAYIKQKGVEEDLVHIGKLNSLTNYMTCSASLSKLMRTFYETLKSAKEDQNVIKQEIATKIFMDKAVDLLEISRITQDLCMGIQRLHTEPTKLYFKEKELKALENEARKF